MSLLQLAAFLAAALLPLNATAAQDAPAFKMEKPKAPVLGTPFQLDIEASLPDAKCRIAIDTTTQPSENFEILAIKKTGEESGASRKFALTAVPFDIGIATFPALSWMLNCPGSPEAELKSPELPFEVAGISTPTAGGGEIIEIRSQYSPAFRPPWWLWVLLAVLCAGIIYWLRRRRAALGNPLSRPDTRPPHVRALDDLEALLLSQLWEEGNFMEFYIRLADILRGYLERRFGLSADRLTTAELHRALLSGLADASVAGSIKNLLNSCDMVKFAKQVPAAEQKNSDVERLRSIIEQTRPAPVPEQGAGQ